MTNNYYFGVYGYDISKMIELDLFILHPIYSDINKASKMALDTVNFNLTAIGEFRSSIDELALFDLAGTLTFCQQQWVIISKPSKIGNDIEQAKDVFPAKHITTNNRPTTGALILPDSGDSINRVKFLKLCADKLRNNDFDEKTNFRQAFFRNVESWRMTDQLIDLTYYLDFSALEILARTINNDFKSSIAKVLKDLLSDKEFDVKQDGKQNREKCMQTYAHLRNALFHNGSFSKQVNDGNNLHEITLNLTDYSDYLRRLVPDVLLKIIGYENEHINWNRWLDRMPFK